MNEGEKDTTHTGEGARYQRYKSHKHSTICRVGLPVSKYECSTLYRINKTEFRT